MDEPNASPPRRVGAVIRWGLMIASIGILAYIVVVGLPDIRESAEAIRRVNPAFILLASGLQVVSLGALAQVYLQSVRAMGGSLNYRKALEVSMSGFTLSRILPGGGATAGLFMARTLNALGVAATTAASAVFVGGALGMAVLGIIVVGGVMTLLFQGLLPPPYLVGIPVMVAAFLFAGILLIKMFKSAALRTRVQAATEKGLRLVGVRASLAGPMQFLDEVARTLPPLRRLARPARWSALNWLADAASLWVLFAAFGQWIHPGMVLVAFGGANLLNALPISPGGLGLVEAGLTGTFVAFGVPAGVALTTVLVYRLISLWLPVAAGVPAYLASAGRRPAVLQTNLPGRMGG